MNLDATPVRCGRVSCEVNEIDSATDSQAENTSFYRNFKIATALVFSQRLSASVLSHRSGSESSPHVRTVSSVLGRTCDVSVSLRLQPSPGCALRLRSELDAHQLLNRHEERIGQSRLHRP